MRDASTILPSLWPDSDLRTAVCRFLARSIVHANNKERAAWVVTLLPNAVRLNVGQVAMLTLQHNRAIIYFRKPASFPLPHGAMQFYKNRRSVYSERAVPCRIGMVRVPLSGLQNLPADFVTAHLDAISAAAEAKRGSPWKNHFSESTLRYIEDVVGEYLPRPDYSGRSSLAELCIYTIRHSDELQASLAKGGTDTYSERKKWVRAKQLVEEARKSGKRLPVIFAPAEGTLHLFAWALLDEVFPGETTRYTFSRLRLLEPQLRKSTLRKASDGKPLDDGFIRPYAVCITPPYLEDELGPVEETVTGEETIGLGTFPEGAVRRVTVNAYERNAEARRVCLERHGVQCAACDMTFAERYGSVAQGFIHVHHLRPLSSVGSDYKVDARADLQPVCPNCHAVIHLRTPPYSIEEVRQMILQRTTAKAE